MRVNETAHHSDIVPRKQPNLSLGLASNAKRVEWKDEEHWEASWEELLQPRGEMLPSVQAGDKGRIGERGKGGKLCAGWG